MTKQDQSEDKAAQTSSTPSEVGDVETAGETTAAAAIHGPVDTRPVGADTMVKVEGDASPGEG